MRKHHRFRPTAFDHLEDRVALSHAGAPVAERARAVTAESLKADRLESFAAGMDRSNQGAYIGIAGFSAHQVGPEVMKVVAHRPQRGVFTPIRTGFSGHPR